MTTRIDIPKTLLELIADEYYLQRGETLVLVDAGNDPLLSRIIEMEKPDYRYARIVIDSTFKTRNGKATT
jgi:hypothetical protein